MHRKQFLSSVIASGAAIKSLGNAPTEVAHKIPKYLQPGDTVGIVAPAGYIMLPDLQPALQKLVEWGLQVKLGKTIGLRNNTFAGTDEDRKNDMQAMLDDDEIAAILCARGGYGLIRYVDLLDFRKFTKKPKWVIGFSDVTTLHSHINSRLGIASIHSKMCNSFPKDWQSADDVQKASIESIWQCLNGSLYSRIVGNPNKKGREGIGEGVLVGGNLRTLDSLMGSKSEIDTNNKILFLEDTGEYLYSIDRMLMTLKRAGKLNHLKGLVIGGFKIKQDDVGEEFGQTLEQIVMEKVAEFDYPVCFDYPVGHQKDNQSLLCGIEHILEVYDYATCLSKN